MAWNEPGGGKKDPWGNRGGNDGGPPDLDEAFRKFRGRLRGLFGGGGDGSGSGSESEGGGGPGDKFTEKAAWSVLGVLVLIWLASGFYIVAPPERGVVTRFGAYHATTTPGPHWHIPWPVHSVEIVNVDRNRTIALPTQLVLTRDENMVRIDLTVQYNVRDARQFLFNVRGPESTLDETIESVVREVVGRQDLDFVMTEGRGEIAEMSGEQIQEIMDRYQAGLTVQTVNLQQAQPPEQVQPAFEDAIMAREDRERLINEAHAVRNELIPAARGDAARIGEEAAAYAFRVVQGARGDTSRFNSVYNEYRNAPDVTRTRLYIDSMERILSETGKVLISGEGDGTNLIYVPLDGIVGSQGRAIDFEEEFGIQAPRGLSGGAAEGDTGGSSLRGDRHRTTREAGR